MIEFTCAPNKETLHMFQTKNIKAVLVAYVLRGLTLHINLDTGIENGIYLLWMCCVLLLWNEFFAVTHSSAKTFVVGINNNVIRITYRDVVCEDILVETVQDPLLSWIARGDPLCSRNTSLCKDAGKICSFILTYCSWCNSPLHYYC